MKIFLAATGACIVAGTALFIWLPGQPTSSAAATSSPLTQTGLSDTSTTGTLPFSSSSSGGAATSQAAATPAAAEGQDDPRIQTAPYDRAQASVDRLRLLVEAGALTPQQQGELLSLKQALLDNAGGSEMALQGLIDGLRQAPDSRTGAHLLSILAEVKQPQVEDLALELSRSSDSRVQTVGLDLLARLGLPSEEAFALTSNLLANDQRDPEVLRSALHAMPEMTLPPAQLDSTVARLTELSRNHPDDGVRSESLFKLARMAKDQQDLAPVMEALAPQREVDDRISAAMALKDSTVSGDQLRDTLVARMSDPEELWEIRYYAAETLQRFRLSDSDYQAYLAFQEELDVIRSGG